MDLPAQTQDHQPGDEHAMHPRPDYAPRFPSSGRLENKVALITGGDSGIGRAAAVLFAREGASVAIVFREETEDAEETRRAIEAEGQRALLIAGDIGDEAFCGNAVAQTLAAFGRLDVLVNNAAEQHPVDDLTELPAKQLERTFRTNVYGYFFMSKAALPYLGEGAAIVNTTSVTAYRGSEHLLDYAATRGAIVAFTRGLAKALVGRGIRVNKVAEFGKKQPLGRVGQPNEVASCHLFLACADSSYMSGQILHPNGVSANASVIRCR